MAKESCLYSKNAKKVYTHTSKGQKVHRCEGKLRFAEQMLHVVPRPVQERETKQFIIKQKNVEIKLTRLHLANHFCMITYELKFPCKQYNRKILFLFYFHLNSLGIFSLDILLVNISYSSVEIKF